MDRLSVTNIFNSIKNGNFTERALITNFLLLLAMDWEVVVRHSHRGSKPICTCVSQIWLFVNY